jgi:hypothetical protein
LSRGSAARRSAPGEGRSDRKKNEVSGRDNRRLERNNRPGGFNRKSFKKGRRERSGERTLGK